jgi:hypothetical protein
MRAFRQRLETALLQGAALAALSLAACSGSEAGMGTGSGGGGESAGSAAVAGDTAGGSIAGSGSGVPVDTLPPYPVDQVACVGPDNEPDAGQPGLHGQCCTSPQCLAPVNGLCATAEQSPFASLMSGFCSCGQIVQGPYASNPMQPAETPGTCCYLVSSIRCD